MGFAGEAQSRSYLHINSRPRFTDRKNHANLPLFYSLWLQTPWGSLNTPQRYWGCNQASCS